MTSMQQRAALQRQIWQIANDVRGSVDGWDFKGLFKKETNNMFTNDRIGESVVPPARLLNRSLAYV